MIELLESRLNLKADLVNKRAYKSCISDLTNNDLLHSMTNISHHSNITRLEHSLHVSYYSYLACRRLGLDYRSAARGGLLHDFYFYDSHVTKPENGYHCFCHPKIALENATKYFDLNDMEKDIIVKHMWPVTMTPPRYKESLLVTFVDKYCASREFAHSDGSRLIPLPGRRVPSI